jgi:hypothetical protein
MTFTRWYLRYEGGPQLRVVIDPDRVAGDPAGIVGCEEGDDRADIGQFADAL